ncbi:MAG: peptidylprolyl isomerase [Nitrospirae bacterium]|nr:peptidylprolyl isomerase [Nitrospirota bacterium]
MRTRVIAIMIGLCLADVSCTKKVSTPSIPPEGIQSNDILSRSPVTDRSEVKHVLVGWRELAAAYRGQIDPRASARNKSDAEQLAFQLLGQVRGGEPIEKLMSEFSEDPGSAKNGQSYTATPDAPLVPPFKDLSLRLNVGEAGIVETVFGWHIIKRVQ